MAKKHGRGKPYTEIGIRRLPCSRCGKPATHQWQVCADNNLYRPICIDCDIELNSIVLVWMGDEDAVDKIHRYKKKMGVKDGN